MDAVSEEDKDQPIDDDIREEIKDRIQGSFEERDRRRIVHISVGDAVIDKEIRQREVDLIGDVFCRVSADTGEEKKPRILLEGED